MTTQQTRKLPQTASSERQWEIGNTSSNLQTDAPNIQVIIQKTQRSELEWGRDDSSPGTSFQTAGHKKNTERIF